MMILMMVNGGKILKMDKEYTNFKMVMYIRYQRLLNVLLFQGMFEKGERCGIGKINFSDITTYQYSI